MVTTKYTIDYTFYVSFERRHLVDLIAILRFGMKCMWIRVVRWLVEPRCSWAVKIEMFIGLPRGVICKYNFFSQTFRGQYGISPSLNQNSGNFEQAGQKL